MIDIIGVERLYDFFVIYWSREGTVILKCNLERLGLGSGIKCDFELFCV
jgi:hypothetical protein